jgi:hypothetical protein
MRVAKPNAEELIMEDLKVQQNLEKNIEKIFEKIVEEGNEGIKNEGNCYPIEEEFKVEIIRTLTGNIYETKIAIKDYNDFRKLIQTLDTLINMYNRLNIKNFEESSKIKTMIEKQIEIIQNTGLVSLDKGYISQYSCLIKCYDSLLRMSRGFVNIKPVVIKISDIDLPKMEIPKLSNSIKNSGQ